MSSSSFASKSLYFSSGYDFGLNGACSIRFYLISIESPRPTKYIKDLPQPHHNTTRDEANQKGIG